MSKPGRGTTLVEPVQPERDHIRGPLRAPVTLLEYGDFECPYSGAAHPVVEAVRATMGRSLSFAFRQFPLTTVHPHAWLAADAVEAAGERGHFWQMHDLLFEDQGHLEPPDLVARARALDLDVNGFAAALAMDAFSDHIQADLMSGVRSGVPGTPTFFVNGTRYGGALDYESLLGAVQPMGARAT
jgi:protein-disulfide isomerase